MLIFLSILALGLGIERLTTFKEFHYKLKQRRLYITKAINDVRKALISTIPIRIFTSEKSIIIDKTIILIKTYKDLDVIRATAISPLTAQKEAIVFEIPSSSNKYLLAIAKCIRKQKIKAVH